MIVFISLDGRSRLRELLGLYCQLDELMRTCVAVDAPNAAQGASPRPRGSVRCRHGASTLDKPGTKSALSAPDRSEKDLLLHSHFWNLRANIEL